MTLCILISLQHAQETLRDHGPFPEEIPSPIFSASNSLSAQPAGFAWSQASRVSEAPRGSLSSVAPDLLGSLDVIYISWMMCSAKTTLQEYSALKSNHLPQPHL